MNKTILITGAGTGIGKDAAIALSNKGHRVIATTETQDQAVELQLEFKSHNLNIAVFKLDITNEEDRKLIENYELDVLINNAGIGMSGSLAEIDIDLVRKNFEVNVFSALELSQIALKKMIERNRGTILFVSSLAGRIVLPFLGPYCMTKFALSCSAEAMRGEIHRIHKNIHVSLIEPGGYHTGFNQSNVANKYDWMNEKSMFYSIIDKLKKEETWQFNLVEAKSTKTIVQKIVKAAEASKPSLRYSAPRWQALGVRLLRIFGK